MFTVGGEGQSRLNILDGEVWVIREDLGIAHACCQPAKNIIHGDAHVPNARFSSTFARFDRDSLAVIVRCHKGRVVRFKWVAKREDEEVVRLPAARWDGVSVFRCFGVSVFRCFGKRRRCAVEGRTRNK